jgi:hypothetical protein
MAILRSWGAHLRKRRRCRRDGGAIAARPARRRRDLRDAGAAVAGPARCRRGTTGAMPASGG